MQNQTDNITPLHYAGPTLVERRGSRLAIVALLASVVSLPFISFPALAWARMLGAFPGGSIALAYLALLISATVLSLIAVSRLHALRDLLRGRALGWTAVGFAALSWVICAGLVLLVVMHGGMC